ncbi:MAG: hypothetical protein NT159_24815 [Proteobacteria bacterium]|nr:hypothetical protein [Pseudomonadota bacterium]
MIKSIGRKLVVLTILFLSFGTMAATPAISTGLSHSCVLLSSGAVQCWGDNSFGQLGNGSITSSNSPLAVTGITNAIALSAGSYHACAVLVTGSVQCWGYNAQGQLGNGTKVDSSSPVTVASISNAIAVSAGEYHTCALRSSGGVQCWGSNGYGRLGNGSTNDSLIPVAVSSVSTAVSLSAGDSHNCVVLRSGLVQCWGYNGFGQLGNNITTGFTPTTSPVSVSSISNVLAVSAGNNHTCALLGNGTLQCWGINDSGQLGNGSTNGFNSVPNPVTVRSISNAIAVSAGHHTCALLSSGTIQCWGANTSGQLGNGTTVDSKTPVTTKTISAAIGVSAGGNYTCALISDGKAECWGSNTSGQLGTGNTTNSAVPVGVVGVGGNGLLNYLDSTTPSFILTITGSGTGSGVISSNPSAINCGSACSASFNSGTSVVLSAVPASSSTFTGWSGACTGTGNCLVTMSAATGVTATFTATPPQTAVASAQSLRQSSYDNGAGQTIIISDSSFTVSVLNPASASGTQIGSGSVSELAIVNECQFNYQGSLFTEQACAMAYNDTAPAIRPDGTVVIPDLFYSYSPGTAHYKVVFSIFASGSKVGLLVKSIGDGNQSAASGTFYNITDGTIPTLSLFAPDAKDCIGSYGVSLKQDTANPMAFWVTLLTFSGQYDWWSGGNTANCPKLASLKLI